MTKIDASEIVVNGVRYVPADTVQGTAPTVDGMPYVIARTFSAGVEDRRKGERRVKAPLIETRPESPYFGRVWLEGCSGRLNAYADRRREDRRK